jgi:hypothetical protein
MVNIVLNLGASTHFPSLDEMESIARKSLVERGRVNVHFLLSSGDGLVLFADVSDDRDVMRIALKDVVDRFHVDKYFAVMEGWFSSDASIRPSLSPDRQEALIISEFHRDMNNRTVFQIFHRVDKEIVFDNRMLLAGKGSEGHSVFNIFVEDAMDEVLVDAQRLQKEWKKNG